MAIIIKVRAHIKMPIPCKTAAHIITTQTQIDRLHQMLPEKEVLKIKYSAQSHLSNYGNNSLAFNER